MKRGHVLSEAEGFSLIELLVVMGIMALIAGVGLVSFRSFGRSSLLDARAKEFVTILESAKVKARSGDLGGCAVLDYYEISIDSSLSYSRIPHCVSGTGTTQSYEIPDNEDIEISEYTAQSTVFDRLGARTTANCYILTDTRTSLCVRVDLTAAGSTSRTKNECSCD